MSKLVLGGERGTYPFNNGGMVSLVPYDKIIPVGDAPQHSLVDGEAGWKDDRLVLIHEIGKFTLQLQVDVERTVQKTRARHPRSEEHTSELQSRPHLVCRLLLE